MPNELTCAAMNGHGEVAFRARRATGETQVLAWDGDALTVVADSHDDGLASIERRVAINDRGDVAFAAQVPSGGEVVVRGNVDGLEKLATTKGAPYGTFAQDVSIDARGRVFVKVIFDDGDFGLMSARQLAQHKIHYRTSDTEFDGDNARTSVRGRRIAFTERLDDGTYGLFSIKGTNVTRIADTSGPLMQVTDPSLGTGGWVAAHGVLDIGRESIFIGRGGALTTIADTTEDFSTFGLGSPSQNSNGEIIFTAVPEGGSSYDLYGGPDPVADAILGFGDPLDGSSVFHVDICGQALNDAGQIAMFVRLLDGRDLIVRADPVT